MLTYIIAAVAIVLLIVIIAIGYVKAPPDYAYIISGLRKKVIIGKSSIKIPILERLDKVSLQLISIDVKTSSTVPTADYININVDAVVNVKVSDKSDLLNLAAQNFLNKSSEYIADVAREVLEGNMREIVGQMELQDMVTNRLKFANLVKDSAEPDLTKMGLEIVSFNVKNFVDENQVIENLGVDNVVQISKKAAIARAQAERDIDIEKAKALKEANDAKVASETEIAKKNNELAIQKADLKKAEDIKMAEAEAAKGIQAEQERKTQEIKTAEANLAKQEKEIELQRQEVAITEQRLDAEIRKKAEADRFAKQQMADAKLYETQKQSEADLYERQKDAEANKFEAEKDAEAKERQAEAVKAQGLAEAEAIKARGEAEAFAVKAKLDAEADGLKKKAEAMKLYGDAARQQMELDTAKVYFEQLPAIAEAVGKAYTNVDKIVMLGGESSQLSGDIMKNITQVSEGLNQSLGINLQAFLSGILGAKVVEKDSPDKSGKTTPIIESTEANFKETVSVKDEDLYNFTNETE